MINFKPIIILFVTLFFQLCNSSICYGKNELFNFKKKQIYSESVIKKQNFYYDLNDVSLLFPLPQTFNDNKLMIISDFVELDLVKKFPRLIVGLTNDEIFKRMYAVSLRVDPILYQIRIVWQPVVLRTQSELTTLDASFHSFHQLTERELYSYLNEIKQLHVNNKIETYNKPLNVLSFNNSNFELQHKYNEIIKKYAQKNNLIKLTGMVLRGSQDMWAFMGLEKKNNQFELIQIPRTANAVVQTYINQAVPFDHFYNAQISNLQNESTDILNLFLIKNNESKELSESEIRDTVSFALKIENPLLSHEDEMDCVSCHIVQSVREFLKPDLVNNNYENKFENNQYNLQNLTSDLFNTRQIRGFGYFGRNIVISQRVINESAKAADEVNKYINSL